MAKKNNFTFTIYNVNEEESEKLKKLYDSGYAKYLTFTHELGTKENNPDIQGFVCIKHAITFLTLKNKISWYSSNLVLLVVFKISDMIR